ncbi:4556_t:CDS:2 [Cetraspora pellucida]|uniref:4556_t:CDS:1 n=1 Tax=Cetraspora pellucida TaxID=1433469 RepID=A0ACA9LPY2_9GLOM|nr:4556_t:CDS:2 [Cetraspora pellucida]
MMHNYTYSLTLDVVMFEEDIQLYDSEDNFEDNIEDNFEDNSIANNLSKVNFNLALNNVDQSLILDEVIDYNKMNFDINTLVN